MEAPGVELTEQVVQPLSAILDERTHRQNLPIVAAAHIKKVGLDSLVGREGEA